MSKETIRKAIQDAVLEVQTYARASGPTAAARRDWKAYAAGLAPVSVRVDEREQYRETFEIAASHSAALLAAMN